MPNILPNDWEVTPRYQILDSAVRHFDPLGETQLHLIKFPSLNYGYLWLCPLDAGADDGFVAFSGGDFGQTRVFGFTETLESIGDEVRDFVEIGALGRRFVLNTRGELRRGNQRAHQTLIVMPDGIARWSNSRWETTTSFRWRPESAPLSSATFVQRPAAQIWADVRALLEDPDSEAAFAREFAHLDPMQRRARIQRPRRGTIEELDRSLHDILLGWPQWGTLGEDVELFLSVWSPENIRMWRIGRGQNPVEFETPATVCDAIRKLWDYFEPFDPAIADFSCVKTDEGSRLFARAYRPSAHEQLEAHLRFQEWLASSKN